jgi:hypothetical protein
MSAQVLTNVQLLVGAMDLAPFSGKFDVAIEAQMKEASNFAALGYTVVLPGLTSATMGIDGHADYATGAVSSTYNTSQRGAQVAAAILPVGTSSVTGDPAVLMEGRVNMMKMLTGAVGEVADFSLGIMSDAAPVDGYVLAPLAARTTTANSSVLAMTGPTATQRVYIGLHTTAASGTTPSQTVTVQSAALVGFGSPTTRAALTAQTTTGWQWTSVAGAITDGFWRATLTISGTTPSFTTSILIGVA